LLFQFVGLEAFLVGPTKDPLVAMGTELCSGTKMFFDE